MKVCTDACVLGAYTTPERLHLSANNPTVLDIGTGTGLLALMAAQNHPTAHIDAVEIDPDAYIQATENVTQSPFANRIQIHQIPVQAFQPDYGYDLILTNPPFFTNHLRSPDAATNRALHTDTLPFPDLVAAANRLLAPDGQWWVLLPPYETELLDKLAGEVGLFPFERLHLQHNARKAPFRHITGYKRFIDHHRAAPQTQSLIIYDPDPTANPAREQYTQAFRELLQPFYLIF